MSKKQLWQHVRPKGVDECDADPVRPSVGRDSVIECAACGDPIRKVSANEGPEALKSLFRF